MSEGHDHHLAATHLRSFSFDARRRRIWMLDLLAERTLPIGIRDAGVKRGLNTVRDGTMANRELERFMARDIEQHAAPVMRRLREMSTGSVGLAPEENEALSRYITLAYARSPRNRERSAEHARTVALQTAQRLADPDDFLRQLALRGHRADPLAAEVVRLKYWVLLREGGLPDAIKTWVITVERALNKPPLIVQLMTKAVVRRETEPFFVVGDCPVLLAQDGAYFDWGGLGFGTEGVRVFVPLSPTALLVCAPLSTTAMANYRPAWVHDDFAAFLNAASIAHAHRFVFAADPLHLERAQRDHARVSAAAASLMA